MGKQSLRQTHRRVRMSTKRKELKIRHSISTLTFWMCMLDLASGHSIERVFISRQTTRFTGAEAHRCDSMVP